MTWVEVVDRGVWGLSKLWLHSTMPLNFGRQLATFILEVWSTRTYLRRVNVTCYESHFSLAPPQKIRTKTSNSVEELVPPGNTVDPERLKQIKVRYSRSF